MNKSPVTIEEKLRKLYEQDDTLNELANLICFGKRHYCPEACDQCIRVAVVRLGIEV